MPSGCISDFALWLLSPSQCLPSPVYPDLQMHLYDRRVFWQIASMLQLSKASAHSSTSREREKERKAGETGAGLQGSSGLAARFSPMSNESPLPAQHYALAVLCCVSP